MKSLIPKSHSRWRRSNSHLIQTMSMAPVLRATLSWVCLPGPSFPLYAIWRLVNSCLYMEITLFVFFFFYIDRLWLLLGYWLGLKDSPFLLAWSGLRWLLLDNTGHMSQGHEERDWVVEGLGTKTVLGQGGQGGQCGHCAEIRLTAGLFSKTYRLADPGWISGSTHLPSSSLTVFPARWSFGRAKFFIPQAGTFWDCAQHMHGHLPHLVWHCFRSPLIWSP